MAKNDAAVQSISEIQHDTHQGILHGSGVKLSLVCPFLLLRQGSLAWECQGHRAGDRVRKSSSFHKEKAQSCGSHTECMSTQARE